MKTPYFYNFNTATISQILSQLPLRSIARFSCCFCIKSVLSFPWNHSVWQSAIPEQCCGVYIERLHPKHLEHHVKMGNKCYCLCNGIFIDKGRHVLYINPSNSAVQVLISASKAMSLLSMNDRSCMSKGKSSLVNCLNSKFDLVQFVEASYSEFRLYGRTKMYLPPGRYSISWRVSCGKFENTGTERLNSKYGYLETSESLRQAWPLISSIRCAAGNKVTRFILNPTKISAFPKWTDVEVAEFQILRVKFNELAHVEMDFTLMTCDLGWKSPLYVESLVIQQI